MASYDKYYPKLRLFEGGWVNNPNDSGGETFMGITRKNHPTWVGWKKVDAYKAKAGFPGTANRDSELRDLVQKFYKVEYWDPIRADEIKSQKIAEQIVDTGVNMGITWAIRFAYRVMGMTEERRISDKLIDKLNTYDTL